MSKILYLIKCQEFYKIGVASDVESRLAQLSTGNPYPLSVEVYYVFDNAEIVEKVIHQRFKSSRKRGEWFTLSYEDKKLIHSVCLSLGGSAYEYAGKDIDEETIEEAEEIQEEVENNKWDFQAMYKDGWRIELVNHGGKPRNWIWRIGSGSERRSIYGGSLSSLPYSLENMRRVYRDGLDPLEEKDSDK